VDPPQSKKLSTPLAITMYNVYGSRDERPIFSLIILNHDTHRVIVIPHGYITASNFFTPVVFPQSR
jgi:hypothetical protein